LCSHRKFFARCIDSVGRRNRRGLPESPVTASSGGELEPQLIEGVAVKESVV